MGEKPMNDDFLYKFRKPPRREFAAALYQRIAKPMKTTSRTHALRALALAFSMIAIFAGVLFFSPPTRAMADSVIRRIGGIIFVQATPQPNPTGDGKDMAAPQATLSPEDKAALQANKNPAQEATVSPEDQATMQAKKDLAQEATVGPEGQAGLQAKEQQLATLQATQDVVLDANAVSRLVGFSVLAPAYLPDGYEASPVGWRVSDEMPNGDAISQINEKAGLEGVSGGAVNNYVNHAADGGIITIEELKVQQGQSKTVDSSQIQDVTVRGQPGVWMPNNDGMNTLAWEENGITYLVVSNQLSQEEALKVAESLGK
jgi:Domain of unknown function (DUF4367)